MLPQSRWIEHVRIFAAVMSSTTVVFSLYYGYNIIQPIISAAFVMSFVADETFPKFKMKRLVQVLLVFEVSLPFTFPIVIISIPLVLPVTWPPLNT